MATYIVKESDLENATVDNPAHLKALRLSDNSVEGETATLESDVILPNTRIKSVPETGSQSSSGSIESEWNVDEQDDLIASAMCGTWEENEDKAEELGAESVKELVLGTSKDVYALIKYFDQDPKEWQVYTGIQVNQMSITMALNSFVKMSFELLGSNNPESVGVNPYADSKYEYDVALTTKAFKTLAGSLEIGDSESNLVALRQAPNFDLSINNNKESTDALFETESIEQSDGDFDVSGNLEIWKADEIGMSIKNDAIRGADKVISVSVYRDWYDVSDSKSKRTTYEILLHAHFTDPTEPKDGNKFKVAIPYTVNIENGIKFTKVVKEN